MPLSNFIKFAENVITYILFIILSLLTLKMESDVVLSRLLTCMAIPGLIGNAIAFLILNRNDMRSSNNYILKGMFFYVISHFYQI